MNAKQKLHQIHLQEWTVRFAEQKASGLTVRQWCEQNHLSFHTYNYWKHLLKEEVVDQALPDIVPITLPVLSDSDTSLETSKTEVRSIRANRAIRSNGTNFRVSQQTHPGGVPCLKMPIPLTLPVSISSADTQTSASGLIHWQPS